MIAFIYLSVVTHLNAADLGAVLQAFGNLWGISFAIMTMGYGLIEIPRYFWYKSDYNKRLQFLYFKIAQLQESKENARDRVDELLYLYERAKSKGNNKSKFVYEFAKIEQVIPNNELNKIKDGNRISNPDITFEDLDNNVDDLKRKHLRKFHMLFKIWLFQLERTNAMYQKTIYDSWQFEELAVINNQLASASSSSLSSPTINSIDMSNDNDVGDGIAMNANDNMNIINLQKNQSELDKLPFCTKLYYKFQIRGMPIVSKCMAIILGIFSLMIMWSEAMIIFDFAGVKPYLSIFALINNSLDLDVSILFGVILFAYLSSCSLFALWRIHINKDYHMHPFGLTDSGSILTNCAFSMRFMFPLGYNFLLMNISSEERINNKDEYPYLYLFHDMSVLPLIGDPVNVFLPMLVIIFCLATWFNVYGKLMKKLRISRFEFGDPKSAANDEIRILINEGKTIARKFKKELNNDSDKKQQFKSYINDRFNTRNKYNLVSSGYSSGDNDLVNVSLVNDSNNNQQNIVKNRGNNKHRFIELQHGNLDD